MTAQSNRERQLKMGIVLAVWRSANWLGARCDHVSLEGRHYSLRKGIKFKGKSIFPGQENGCHCSSAPVIKGFIDDLPTESILNRVKRLFGY